VSLHAQKEIVIRLADKNMGWTLLTTNQYKQLMLSFLNNPKFFKPFVFTPMTNSLQQQQQETNHLVNKELVLFSSSSLSNPCTSIHSSLDNVSLINCSNNDHNDSRCIDNEHDVNQKSTLIQQFYFSPLNEIFRILKLLIKDYNFEPLLTTACERKLHEKKFNEWQVPHVYGLPKVHKSPLDIRPIVACHSWFTTPVSVYLDALVRKTINFEQAIPTYLKDTLSLVQMIETTPIRLENETLSDTLEKDVWLVSGDITALYPNIPIHDGVTAFRDFLTYEWHYHSAKHHPHRKTDHEVFYYLAKLARTVMDYNLVCFDDKYYQQIHGTAMGTPFAVLFSIIYVHTLEMLYLFDQKPAGIILWKRYIDDILIVYKGPFQPLKMFLDKYNTMAETIQVNWKYSQTSIDFLDLTLKVDKRYNSEQRLLDVRLFRKPGNAYQYIPYDTAHPPHIKKAFPIAELKRICRNCSIEEDFLEEKRIFFQLLRHRGYPPELLDQSFNQVHFSSRLALIFANKDFSLSKNQTINSSLSKNKNKSDRPIFVTRYSPFHRNVNLKHILTQHKDVLFPEASNHVSHVLLSYSKSKNLKEHFSTAKFTSR